jgi:hypothetical protein
MHLLGEAPVLLGVVVLSRLLLVLYGGPASVM